MTYLQRKKLAFMSIVNSVKGFIRTVSGVPPLTLPDCVDENSLISYTITGEGVGDYDEGTGKYKVPVVCSGKNILNPDLFKYYSGSATGLVNRGVFVKANTTYTLSVKRIVNCTSYRINFVMFDSNKNLIQNTTGGYAYDYPIVLKCDGGGGWYWHSSHWIIMNANINWYPPITFMPKQDMYIAWYIAGGDTTASTYAENPQIEAGTSKTDYEPYVTPTTTNIYLDEPLAEGETIKKPVKLPTVKGTTVYTVNTTTKPENFSATYYSASKE